MIMPFSEEALAQARIDFGHEVQCCVLDVRSPPLFVEVRADRLKRDRDAFVKWFEHHRETFEVALIRHGAVVLRGFPLHDTDDFIALIASLPAHRQDYAAGAAIRTGIKSQVLEASATVKERFIPLHQEMSYLPQHPRLIAFFCKRASETGGATLICDMRRVTQSLPEDMIGKLERKGVRYKRNLLAPGTEDIRRAPEFGHNTWSLNFGTEDPDELERVCQERGLRAEWQTDGSVNLVNETPALVDHPVTGDRVFFNQLHAQAFSVHVYGKTRYEKLARVYRECDPPFKTSFGDGEPITTEELDVLYRAHAQATVNFPWNNGDVMFVENKLTAHGRDAYTGSRDVQVALID